MANEMTVDQAKTFVLNKYPYANWHVPMDSSAGAIFLETKTTYGQIKKWHKSEDEAWIYEASRLTSLSKFPTLGESVEQGIIPVPVESLSDDPKPFGECGFPERECEEGRECPDSGAVPASSPGAQNETEREDVEVFPGMVGREAPFITDMWWIMAHTVGNRWGITYAVQREESLGFLQIGLSHEVAFNLCARHNQAVLRALKRAAHSTPPSPKTQDAGVEGGKLVKAWEYLALTMEDCVTKESGLKEDYQGILMGGYSMALQHLAYALNLPVDAEDMDDSSPVCQRIRKAFPLAAKGSRNAAPEKEG